MTDQERLDQIRANFQIIGGVAEAAQFRMQISDDEGFKFLNNLDRFIDDSYCCEATEVTDPVIKPKVDALVESGMHKDYMAFKAALQHLNPKIKGAKVHLSPSLDKIMKDRNMILDTEKDDKGQIKDILLWFVNGPVKEFNNNQDKFK